MLKVSQHLPVQQQDPGVVIAFTAERFPVEVPVLHRAPAKRVPENRHSLFAHRELVRMALVDLKEACGHDVRSKVVAA